MPYTPGCVCMFVLYRNPNSWMGWDEIWQGGCPRGQEDSWVFFDLVPTGYRVHKGGLGCPWSLSHLFWQKLHKTKVSECPNLVGVSHIFVPKIWLQKDLVTMSFWSHGRGVYKTKVV